MKKLLFLVASCVAFQVHANSAWLEQNKLVGEIGGWKIYAKEQASIPSTPNQNPFTLSQAIERMLQQQLDTTNYLPNSESISDYYLLSHAQRSALQQRYSIIYETSKSYYELVALREKLVYAEDVLDAVEAASELTSRMYKIGNVSELKLLKQNKDLYKKRIEYKAMQAKYLQAKERFIQSMNFDSRDLKTNVESRLPDPPKESRKLSDKEQRAIDLGAMNDPGTLKTRSVGRISYDSYLEKYSKAKSYKDDILPAQKKISEETLLRYNGMLIDVFHLLEEAESQSKTVIEYIDANVDFLIQSARLEKDLIDAQMDYSNINVR